MSAEELKIFISENIPTFQNIKIIENRVAYHYTSHYDKLVNSGKFLGAPINKELDKTQLSVPSKPATSDPGVVFAYQNLYETIEEGENCDIIKIYFSQALQATHIQENVSSEDRDTILILNTDIKRFKKIVDAEDTKRFY